MDSEAKAQKPANRRGRPPFADDTKAKRSSFTLRVRQELRDRVHAEAESSGRSMSEVLEHIVERHFDREALLADVRQAVQAARPLIASGYRSAGVGVNDLDPFQGF